MKYLGLKSYGYALLCAQFRGFQMLPASLAEAQATILITIKFYPLTIK